MYPKTLFLKGALNSLESSRNHFPLFPYSQSFNKRIRAEVCVLSFLLPVTHAFSPPPAPSKGGQYAPIPLRRGQGGGFNSHYYANLVTLLRRGLLKIRFTLYEY